MAAGYRATCGRPADKVRDQPRHLRILPNASWHLSSISGGLAGHVFKLRSNSETILSQKLLDWEHIRVRRASCMDHLGRDGQMRGNRSWYVATRWSPTRLPAYPDVPRVLEVLLRRDRTVQSTYRRSGRRRRRGPQHGG